MRMDKLTSHFQSALADAQSLAIGYEHQFIEPEHVIKALLDQADNAVGHLLNKAGIHLADFKTKLDDSLQRMAKVEGVPGEIHISNDLQRVLNVTDKLAQQR